MAPGAGESDGIAFQLLDLCKLLNSCALKGAELDGMSAHKS